MTTDAAKRGRPAPQHPPLNENPDLLNYQKEEWRKRK